MYALNPPPSFSCNTTFCQAKSRSSSCSAVTISMHTGERSSPELKKSAGYAATSSLLGRVDNTIGIIGGVSVFSTLIFLEKLVWWSSRHGNECVPFIVCSDPGLSREFPRHNLVSSFYDVRDQHDRATVNGVIIENLRRKREFLERSGARCIVMPCHLSHSWYNEVSKGCSLPFLHLGECVARELKAANLKPLEAGSNIRIGLISTYATMKAGFYQEKLQNQGFEVLLPDNATMEHIVFPAITALNRKDIKGGQNLLRIAINILLMRGSNMVVIAADKLQGLLPSDDPLAKKCIDPNDALARSTITWAQSVGKVLK
uniref:Aspartate racemase n=1 Tax=Kalanchoe fedtschenkoi TaxID=63787 RepID=A0A7N0TDX5_KALFE